MLSISIDTRPDDRGMGLDERLALAAAVADPHRPKPFRLDADNNNAGQLPGLEAAVGSGSAYVVTVAPDVLALDVDHPDIAPALDRLHDELVRHGWPSLRTESGREGHRHLFAIVTAAADRAYFDAQRAGLGLPKFRTTMRPPGTPHRNGFPVSLVDELGPFLTAAAEIRGQGEQRARLDWLELLRTGRFPRGWSGDRSGSNAVWLICSNASRRGYTLDQVRTMLLDNATGGGRSYARRCSELGQARADDWLERNVWPSAVAAGAARPGTPADADEARVQIAAIRAAVEAEHWPGVAGATDRRGLLVLLDRADARGSLTPTMSYREWAELAGCSLRTVPTMSARLRAAGWLLVAEAGRGTTVTEAGELREVVRATRWRVRVPVGVARTCTTGGTPPTRTELSGATSREWVPAALDACRWRGFGPNGRRVLEALEAGPLDATELAARLRMNRRHFCLRLLPKLAAYGLIVRVGTGWGLCDDLPAALTAAAEDMGLAGKTEATIAAHRRERAGYLEHRERMRPVRDRHRREHRLALLERHRALELAQVPRIAVPAPGPRRAVPDDHQLLLV